MEYHKYNAGYFVAGIACSVLSMIAGVLAFWQCISAIKIGNAGAVLAVTTFVVALFFGVYLAIYWIISREVINTTLRRLLFILLIAIDIAMIVCGFFILANVPGGLQVVDWVIAVFLVLGLLAVGVGVGIFISVIDELITIRKIQKAGERDH